MRIGFEAQRLFRRRKHGMDVVALELLRELARIDGPHEIVLFVRPGEDPVDLAAFERIEVRTIDAPSYPFWEQVALPRAAKTARLDLLHCTANTAPLRAGVPLVVTLHDVIFLEGGSPIRSLGSWYQRLGNVYRRAVCPHVAAAAARVVTVSDFEAGEIARRLPRVGDRLRVVPNAVAERFAPVRSATEQAAARERHGLPARFALYFGNTDGKKNLAGTLAGWVRHVRETPAALELVVADLARPRLLEMLSTLGASDLAPLIHAPGYIPQADLPAVYTQTTAYLYPSLRESFGLPILEAMACGAPVVTSSTSAMPEVAGGAALLVDPCSPGAIASALSRLATEPRLAGLLRARGFERARHYSWRHSAELLFEVYQEALGSGSSSREVRSSRLGAGSSKVAAVC